MVLNFARGMAVLLMTAVMAVSPVPVAAHEDHDEQSASKAKASGSRIDTPGAMHETVEEHAEAINERKPKPLSGRLMSWIGRTHPFAVHFPIALFPVALAALILTRRRGESLELIRALIVVAGSASVIAGVLGWFAGGFALTDTDWVHLWHRWIGTTLAALGAGVAVWALKDRSSVMGGKMVALLAAITALLLVQGWLGAALVHGIDHMSF